MKKLGFVFFLAFVIWGCASPKEDKVRLHILKGVYDEKWGFCNRSLYAQEKTTVENGSKDADMKIWKESLYYRDSTLKYLEGGKVTLAREFITKGLESKKLNTGKLIVHMNQLDSAYHDLNDSTSLLYAEISVVSGLSHILRDNSARLGSSY